MTACGQAETAVTPAPTRLPAAEHEVAPGTPANEATAVPTPTAALSLTATPQPSPTAVPPIRLGAQAGMPEELVAALHLAADTNPEQFVWDEEAAEVQLVFGGDTQVAEWVLAVAAPFATLQDEITFTDLQAAWRLGELVLTQEMAQLLMAVWGMPDTPNQIVTLETLVPTLWSLRAEVDTAVMTVIPFAQLDKRLKVLRVDGSAPIDMEFDQAGYALTIPVGLAGDEPALTAVADTWVGPLTNRDDGRVTHVVMTGPAGMRRAVADRMEKYGITYPVEETGPVLQAADIAHMSDEDPFAPNCPLPDPNDSTNVCNREEYFELMLWLGIDVAEATGNHLNDWGTWAMDFTLDLYEANGIQWFGGGRNLVDAAEPVLIEHNGNRIAFVGCNPTGPEYSWATETEPGTLPCGDYSQLKAQIARLAAEGYLVITTLQYLEDYQYNVLDPQRQVFQSLAEAGATAVSGSHGHHPQGFSFHNDAFIHYGLGNLLADQMWSLGTRQTFLDVYTFYDGRLLNVDLWTGLNEDYGRIRQMTPKERRDLLQAVFAASDW